MVRPDAAQATPSGGIADEIAELVVIEMLGGGEFVHDLELTWLHLGIKIK
jgi:hypothetical protein